MKIKCIIVEDEPKAMGLMEDYVSKTPFLDLTAKFYNPLDAINHLQEHDVDLVFLDINLPELSGMDMAGIISASVKVIFTTAYSDYAAKSYEVNTVDYLLKPVTYTRFFQAASKAKMLIEKDGKQVGAKPSEHVFVKSGKKLIQLNWGDILYIEGLKEYLSIVTASQKIIVYKRMAEFERMQPANFKRVHNSFIVNIDKIDKVVDNMLFINNREIPVSKSYKEEFFATIRDKLI